MSIKLIDLHRMINLMQGYRLTFEFDNNYKGHQRTRTAAHVISGRNECPRSSMPTRREVGTRAGA
jgi:hypothetical protein